MRTLISVLTITGCFAVGFLETALIGTITFVLCVLSFILGVITFEKLITEKAANGELIEAQKKYYELKYVKDKVE